jgi:hypothetical protein
VSGFAVSGFKISFAAVVRTVGDMVDVSVGTVSVGLIGVSVDFGSSVVSATDGVFGMTGLIATGGQTIVVLLRFLHCLFCRSNSFDGKSASSHHSFAPDQCSCLQGIM